MSDYSHIALKDSVGRLLAEIATQSSDSDPNLKRLETLARLVSIHLKAIDELQDHERREAERKEQSKYTRFEDLAPPSPEEQARMIETLNRHFGVTPDES